MAFSLLTVNIIIMCLMTVFTGAEEYSVFQD